jgi:hypothetical protein
MPLTKEERDKFGPEMFAFPRLKKCPLNDETHTRLAWDMVDRTQGATRAERKEARRRILRRAKELGIDTTAWEKSIEHEADDEIVLQIEAMAIAMPDVADHPNRMPFSGVLTFVDTPSDMAVGGAGGKRTYLPRAVAEVALPTLLGMAIDFTPNLDGHDAQNKIGLITSADIVGDEIRIGGFFYAADFPQECARIKSEKEDLGFSYEIRAQTREMGGDLLQIVSGVFTGAAVLKKNKAAYQSTSLAAKAAGDIDMTPEELKKLLAEAVAPLTAQLDTLNKDVTTLKAGTAPLQANKEMRDRIAPHVAALRNCAASMEAAGIGLHSERGHVRVLHHMCASMEADAARGQLPHIYRDHDWSFSHASDPARNNQPAAIDPKAIGDAVTAAIKPLQDELAAAKTIVTDLQAKAFKDTPAPQRKTLSPEGTALLQKAGLKPDETSGKVKVRELEAAADKAQLTNQQSIALKIALQSAGMLEAA